MSEHLCDCGKILHFVEYKTYEVVTPIKKDGTLSKRKKKPFESHMIMASAPEDYHALECYSCENRYDLKGIDKDGKVLKGRKFINPLNV